MLKTLPTTLRKMAKHYMVTATPSPTTYLLQHIVKYLLLEPTREWSKTQKQCRKLQREEAHIEQHRVALKKNSRYYLGIFPKWRTPHPPLLGTPDLKNKIIVYFAFQALRNIFG